MSSHHHGGRGVGCAFKITRPLNAASHSPAFNGDSAPSRSQQDMTSRRFRFIGPIDTIDFLQKKKKARMGAAVDWLQLWRGPRPNSFSDGAKTVGGGYRSEGGWESKRFTPGEKSSVSCAAEA